MSERNPSCPCTETDCSNHGVCRECVSYHRQHDQLPGCYFDAAGEKTKDRSIENWLRLRKKF